MKQFTKQIGSVAVDSGQLPKSRAVYERKYYLQRRKSRIDRGLCTACGGSPPRPGRMTCSKCSDKQKKRAQTSENKEKERQRSRKRYKENPKQHAKVCRNYINKLKEEMFNLYGNKCECCGETTKEFLTIDHINGGGGKHRKENHQSILYKKIIQENDKNKYRTLCMNCNWGSRLSGTNTCPHKLIK